MTDMKIRVVSVSGSVQYCVVRRTGASWIIVKSFNTRREAKRFIESQR